MSNSTESDLFEMPPPEGIIVVAATLIPLSVFGIFTNVTTIAVVIKSPKLKTTFNYFIASLAMSDLTSAVISTLFLYRVTWGYHKWLWPAPLCSLFFSMDIWTSYVTSTHILLFSSLRFVSVQWPVIFKAITVRHAKIFTITIWLVTYIIGGIPFAIWFKPNNSENRTLIEKKWPACALDIQRKEEFQMYTRLAYPLFFYIPIVLIACLSVGIAVKIHVKRKKRTKLINMNTKEMKRRRKENKMMLQLGLIVGSFLLGYITYSVYHLTTVEIPSNTNEKILTDWWFGFIEYLLLRISECLNPIFYNLASSVMRRETKNMLTGVWNSLTFTTKTLEDSTERRDRNETPDDEEFDFNEN